MPTANAFPLVLMLLLPLFMLSGVLAYFLIKQIDKDEKRKGTGLEPAAKAGVLCLIGWASNHYRGLTRKTCSKSAMMVLSQFG